MEYTLLNLHVLYNFGELFTVRLLPLLEERIINKLNIKMICFIASFSNLLVLYILRWSFSCIVELTLLLHIHILTIYKHILMEICVLLVFIYLFI